MNCNTLHFNAIKFDNFVCTVIFRPLFSQFIFQNAPTTVLYFSLGSNVQKQVFFHHIINHCLAKKHTILLLVGQSQANCSSHCQCIILLMSTIDICVL